MNAERMSKFYQKFKEPRLQKQLQWVLRSIQNIISKVGIYIKHD